MSLAKEFKEKVREKNPAYQKARQSLWEYEKIMNPQFFREDRWHLKAIAETLQALVEDRIIRRVSEKEWHIATGEEIQALMQEEIRYEICKKMMMNIPPRHGKSYSLQEFEKWSFGRDQETSVITVSYNDILSGRFSGNVRNGIEEQKIDRNRVVFSDVFPAARIKAGDGAKNIWSLVGRFFSYLGTGFGGTITGIGCRIGVIDDPIKNDKEAFNDRVLEEQYTWYTDTFLSRIEEGGYIIINMTRWANGDLCGKLLEKEPGEWYVLQYPACLNAEKVYQVFACQESRELSECAACEEYPCQKLQKEPMDENGEIIGEMMCPELLSFRSWNQKRRITSPAIFLANYQQQPVDVTNALYGPFKTYAPEEIDVQMFERICSYADTADEGADFLCNICFGVIDEYIYVQDVYYTDEGMEMTEPETARRIKQFKVREAVIESNNGGRGFARNVKKKLKEWNWSRTVVYWFHQSLNKKARILSHASNVMEQVIMPEGWEKKWPEFYQHIRRYQKKGNNSHDDAEDCLTGVVEYVNGEIKVKKKAKVGSKRRLGL